MSRIGRKPIAIPAGVTVTVAEDNTVTVRERDSMEQIRMNIDDLVNYITEKTAY